MAAGYLNKITGACTWHSWQLVTGGDSETVCTESASGWNSNSSSSMSDCLDRDTALQCTLALWVAISDNLANWPKNTAKQRTNVEFSHCFHFYQERKLPPANKHVTDYLVSPYGCHPAPHKSATVQWAAIVCSGGKQWGGSDDSKHKTQTRVTPASPRQPVTAGLQLSLCWQCVEKIRKQMCQPATLHNNTQKYYQQLSMSMFHLCIY